jgi:hypothetical protein
MLECVDAWAEECAGQRKVRLATTVVWNRTREGALRYSVSGWRLLSFRAGQLRRVCQLVVGRLRHGLETRALRLWYEHTCLDDDRRLEGLLAKACARLTRVSVVKGFRRWQETVAVQSVWRRAVQRLGGRRRRDVLAGVVEGWRARCVRDMRLRAVLVTVAGKADRLLCTSVFAAWMERAAALRVLRVRGVAAATRWMQHGVCMAFEAWVCEARARDERRKAHEMRARLARRWVHRGVLSAFATWQQSAATSAGLSRVARRWVHRRLCCAFMAWQQSAARRAWLVGIGQDAVGRWTGMRLVSAMGAWREAAKSMVRVRRVVVRGGKERKRRMMLECVDAWAEECAGQRKVRLALRRFHRHSLLKFHGRFFSSWFMFARDSRRRRLVAQRISSRLGGKLCVSSYHAWFYAVEDARHERAKCDALRRRSKVHANEKEHAILSFCFAAWCEQSTFLCAARESARGRKQAKIESVARQHLSEWALCAREGFSSRKFAELLLITRTRTARRDAFLAWSASASALKRLVRTETRLHSIGIRMVDRHHSILVESAFGAWKEHICFVDAVEELNQRAGEMSACDYAERAFGEWRQMVRQRMVSRRVSAVLVRRHTRGILRVAVMMWCVNTRVQVAEGMRKIELEHAGVIVSRRHTRMLLTSSWVAWRDRQLGALEEACEAQQIESSLARWELLQEAESLRSALASWSTHTQLSLRLSRSLEAARLQNTSRLLEEGMMAWRDTAILRRGYRQACVKQLLCHIRRLKARAMRSWLEVLRIRSILVAVIGRRRQRDERSAFCQWDQAAGVMRRAKHVKSIIARRQRKRDKTLAFSRWQDAVAEVRGIWRAGRTECVVRAHAHRGLVRSAYDAWHIKVWRASLVNRNFTCLQAKLRLKLLLMAAGAWHGHVSWSRSCRRRTCIISERRFACSKHAAFLAWASLRLTANAHGALRDRRLAEWCMERQQEAREGSHACDAIQGWRKMCVEARRRRAVSRSLSTRHALGLSYAALVGWADEARYRRCMRFLLIKGRMWMLFRAKWHVLDSWKQAVSLARECRAREARDARQEDAARDSYMLSLQKRCLEHWRTASRRARFCESTELRVEMALCRLSEGRECEQLAVIVRCWRALVSVRERTRRLCGFFTSCSVRGVLGETFGRWYACAAECVRERVEERERRELAEKESEEKQQRYEAEWLEGARRYARYCTLRNVIVGWSRHASLVSRYSELQQLVALSMAGLSTPSIEEVFRVWALQARRSVVVKYAALNAGIVARGAELRDDVVEVLDGLELAEKCLMDGGKRAGMLASESAFAAMRSSMALDAAAMTVSVPSEWEIGPEVQV